MFVQDVVEKKQTILAFVNTKSNKAELMTKMPCFWNARGRMRHAGSETQQRRRKTGLKTFEVMRALDQDVLISRESAENHVHFKLQVSRCRVNSRLVATLLSL